MSDATPRPAATPDRVAVCRPHGDPECLSGVPLAVLPLDADRLAGLHEAQSRYAKVVEVYGRDLRAVEVDDPGVLWFEVHPSGRSRRDYEAGESAGSDVPAWDGLVAAVGCATGGVDDVEGDDAHAEKVEAFRGLLSGEERRWAVLPASWFPREGNLRTDVNRLQLSQVVGFDPAAELAWSCLVKHTSDPLETPVVGRDELAAWSRAVANEA